MSNETMEFLDQLWGGKPDDLYLLIWTLADRKSAWFRFAEDAAQYVAGLSGDVYVGVGLSEKDYGPHLRCPANDIAGIAGLWADIDYEDGDAHKSITNKLPYPPDEESAHKVIEAVSMRPTIVIHSGHGLQAWWLLKEPLIFDNDVERKAAAMMARLWQKNIQKRASLMGWSVDSVPDLARLLRVPGTLNCKTEPVPVRMIQSDGPWYLEISDLEIVLPETMEDVKANDDSGGSARGRDYWRETVQGVSEGDRNNRMTSFAGKLFSIIGDIDDQDGGFLVLQYMILVNSRNKPPLDEAEVRNSWQSIWKKEKSARASLEAEELFGEQNDELLSEEGAVDARLEIVSSKLGNLPIREITKRGKHDSEYVFELENGTLIIAGDILNQQGVRKAVLDATSGDKAIVVPLLKQAMWTLLCGSIARLSREIEMPDAERKERVGSQLQMYLSGTKVVAEEQWKGALNDGSPFQRSGMIHINVNHFFNHVRFELAINEEGYLRKGLIDLGFVACKVQAWIENEKGGKKNKGLSYWTKAYDDVLTPESAAAL